MATAAHSKRPAEQKPARETSAGNGHFEGDATLCKRPRVDAQNFQTTAAAPKDGEPSRQAALQLQQLAQGVLADVSLSPHFTPAAAAAAPQEKAHVTLQYDRQQLNQAPVAAPSTPELKPAPAPAFAPASSFQNVLVARLKKHSEELLRMNEIARERLRRVAEKTRQLDQVRQHVNAAVVALHRREAASIASGALREIGGTARVMENPFSGDGGVKSGVVDGAIDASARLRNPRADLREARGSALPDEDEADSGERGLAAPAAHTAGDEEDKWVEGENDTRSSTGASSSSDSTGSVTGPRRLTRSTNGGSVSLLPFMGMAAACGGGGSPACRPVTVDVPIRYLRTWGGEVT
ncbi:unnamed protein product [Closterium sp. Naga37s-1]|nr:unnamed protein product [Closterium sp. Naga37s-1]